MPKATPEKGINELRAIVLKQYHGRKSFRGWEFHRDLTPAECKRAPEWQQRFYPLGGPEWTKERWLEERAHVRSMAAALRLLTPLPEHHAQRLR
jgi:hypothetical protein